MAAIQTDPQYKLRLPAELLERIRAAAEANNRSMNAEIVSTLAEKYDPEDSLMTIARTLEALSRLQGELTPQYFAKKAADIHAMLGSEVSKIQEYAQGAEEHTPDPSGMFRKATVTKSSEN